MSRRAGTELAYTTSAIDPAHESVAVRFDWGDGDTSAWSAWLASGASIADSHSWSAVGNYSVRAQAMTPVGTISDWSKPLEVPIVQTWTRAIGGSFSDEGSGVIQASDGGYVVAGFTSSFGAGRADIYLIKTDADGNVDWTRTFGDTNIDCGYSISSTIDGGYVISGTLGDSAYLVKTDAQGNKLWERTLGANYHHRPGQMLLQSSDGGYAALYDDTSSYLVKTDGSGNQVWVARFDFEGESVLETGDSGFVVVGEVYELNGQDYDVGLVKLSRSRGRIWAHSYARLDDQYGRSLQPTADGGYVIAGFDWAQFRLLLVKTDADGREAWTKEFGPRGSGGRSIARTLDGGYIIAGSAPNGAAKHEDVYLLKTDASGDSLWATCLGDSGNDIGYSVRQASDGGFVITGTRFTRVNETGDVLLIKTDSRGEVKP
jgi:hypothetical protein